jgi:hypothetical protein
MTNKTQGHLKSAHMPPACLVSHNVHSVNYIIPRSLPFACTYEEPPDYVPENLGMISSW